MVAPRQGILATHMLVRGSTLVLGAALGLVLGCPFELQRGLSCGDGWWDPEFEECDPRDPDQPYLEACRDQGGFKKNAECDPQTCTVRASEAECNECGDGRAADTEQCDGEDLRGATCLGVLSCDDDCRLDYSACEQDCGDGIVLGNEECEFDVDGGFKNLACSDYDSTAIGLDKPYASGTIGSCNKDTCTFGRNDCSFCGDGERDPQYLDIIAPQGTAEFPVEICDGSEVEPTVLEEHCEALCIDDPINGDVVVHCDFECADNCSGIAPVNDIIPDPAALGCCVAKDAPCPKFGIEGVPDLPCCSWLENPDWLAEEKCVVAETNTIPITFICP
jgi:hypothetical protein